MSRLLTADMLGETQAVTVASLARNPTGMFHARFADGQSMEQVRPIIPRAQPVDVLEEDPLEQVRADAFAQGFDEGVRVATESFSADDTARSKLAEAMEKVAPSANGALSALLSAAVLRLVTQVAGEVSVDAALLAQRVDRVAAFIEEGQARNRLHIHPDDIALLEGRELGIALHPDPAMGRGCIRLDTADGWIEDGPDVQLSRLKALLDTIDEGQA